MILTDEWLTFAGQTRYQVWHKESGIMLDDQRDGRFSFSLDGMQGYFISLEQAKSDPQYEVKEFFIVPKDPPEELLRSMAIRYNHAFSAELSDSEILAMRENGELCGYSYLTSDEKRAILVIMKQIYEEVIGKGFYTYG